jgi:hypothetical protein
MSISPFLIVCWFWTYRGIWLNFVLVSFSFEKSQEVSGIKSRHFKSRCEGALNEIASIGGGILAGRAAGKAEVLSARWWRQSSFTGDHLLVGLGNGVLRFLEPDSYSVDLNGRYCT